MSNAAVEPPVGLRNPPPPFDVTPYRPDGGFTPKNSALLLGGYLFAGAVLGIVAYFVSKAIWLILIFPLLIGFILGGIGIAIVQKTKIRNPVLAGIAGFLGGCLAMLVMHYATYLEFRSNSQEQDPQRVALLEMDEAQRAKEVDKRIDIAVQELDPQTREKLSPQDREQARRQLIAALDRDSKVYNSFWSYMDERAVEGVRIQGTRHKNESNLGYVGSYIYWGIEVLIIAGVALGMVWSAARKPFCTQCETWKTPLPMASLAVAGKDLDAAVREGEPWRPLKDGNPPPEREACDLLVDCCPNCQENAPIEVRVVRRTWNKKNEITAKEFARVTYPGLALPVLVLAFQPAPDSLASAVEHEQLPPENPAEPGHADSQPDKTVPS